MSGADKKIKFSIDLDQSQTQFIVRKYEKVEREIGAYYVCRKSKGPFVEMKEAKKALKELRQEMK